MHSIFAACITAFLFFASIAYSQKTIIHIDTNGKVIDQRKTTINNYNVREKDNILNVNKYIDTTKEVWIDVGTNKSGLNLQALKAGRPIFYGALKSSPDLEVIRIKLVKGRLLISSDINAFDGKYIAKIRDNKLIASNNYRLNATDRYFEVFDDYDVPVLQIELDKKTNTIFVCGAFNTLYYYQIVTREGVITESFGKSKLLMSHEEYNKWLNQYLILTEKIQPIHDEH